MQRELFDKKHLNIAISIKDVLSIDFNKSFETLKDSKELMPQIEITSFLFKWRTFSRQIT